MSFSGQASLHPAFTYFRDRTFLLIAFAVVLAMHGEKLFVFTLGIDGEHYSYHNAAFWLGWIGQGRWAMGLLVKALPPFSAMPIMAPAFFCVGLVAASLMLAPLLTQGRRQALLFCGLFAGSPLWAHVAQFDTLSWGVAICLICVAAALWLLHDGKAVWAVPVLAFAIGIYQSALFLFAAALIPLLIGGTDFWRVSAGRIRWVNALAVTAAGTVLSAGLGKLALILTGQELTYVTGYVHLETLFSPAASLAMAKHVAGRLFGLIGGRDPTYLGWGGAVLAPMWIGALFGAVRLVRTDWPALAGLKQCLGLCGLLALLAVPLFLTGDSLPIRALTMVPLILALIGANTVNISRLNTLQWAVWGYSLLVSAWISTSLYYSAEITHERDVAMGTRLMERIEAVGRPAFGPSLPVALIGYWVHDNGGPAVQVEIFGDSFFEHDSGNVFRVISFLRYIGLQGVYGVPLRNVPGVSSVIETMPSWPAPGSVAVVANAVVVKLGAPSERQLLDLRQ